MSARPRRDRRTRFAAPLAAALLIGLLLAWSRRRAPLRPTPPRLRSDAPTSAPTSPRPPAGPGHPALRGVRRPGRRRGLPRAGEGLHHRAPRRDRQGRGRRPTPSRPRTTWTAASTRAPRRTCSWPGRRSLASLVAGRSGAARRRAPRGARRAVRRQLPAARARGVRRRRGAAVHAQRRLALRRLLQQAAARAPHARASRTRTPRRAPERGWTWEQFVAAARAMSQGRREGRSTSRPGSARSSRWSGRPAPTSSTTPQGPDHADASPTSAPAPALEEILSVARDPSLAPDRPPAGPAGRGHPLRERPARR